MIFCEIACVFNRVLAEMFKIMCRLIVLHQECKKITYISSGYEYRLFSGNVISVMLPVYQDM